MEEQFQYFAAVHHCPVCTGKVSVIRFNTETKSASIFNLETREFDPIPEGRVFDPEVPSYKIGSSSDDLASAIFGESFKTHDVVRIDSKDWEFLVYEIPNGWEQDEFGDWSNDHYQVGAKIRLNCQTGEWEFSTHLRTESFGTKHLAFLAWESMVKSVYPHFVLHS